MNKKFLSELTKLEDYEFFVLEHHFSIARMVRDAITKNGLTEKFMAEKLGVQPKRMKEVIMGSYPFGLRLLSKLQSYLQDRAYTNAKLKIESETIGFNTYKYQFPMYVNRIEKLIDILEKKEVVNK